MNKEVLILGTGKSLNNLSSEEKEYINTHNSAIILNYGYLHQELAGLELKYLYINDVALSTLKMLIFPSIEKMNKEKKEVVFFINKEVADLYYKGGNDLATPLINSLKYYRAKKVWRPRRNSHVKIISVATLVAQNHPEMNLYWAQSLKEPLYHYRGTLTSAINLADIYFKPTKIKLLGIDMNTPYHFYDRNEEELNARLNYHKEAYNKGLHATAVVNHRGAPPLQEKLPTIFSFLKQKGVEVVCCNPKSLLVEEDICPYEPLLP